MVSVRSVARRTSLGFADERAQQRTSVRNINNRNDVLVSEVLFTFCREWLGNGLLEERKGNQGHFVNDWVLGYRRGNVELL